VKQQGGEQNGKKSATAETETSVGTTRVADADARDGTVGAKGRRGKRGSGATRVRVEKLWNQPHFRLVSLG